MSGRPQSSGAAPSDSGSSAGDRARASKTLRALRAAQAARERSAAAAKIGVGDEGNMMLTSPQAAQPARPLSPGREFAGALIGMIGNFFGLLLFLVSLVFFAGSLYFGSILGEISQRDFSGPIKRISHYEVLFESVAKAGYEVRPDKPTILNGVTTYLWVVQPQRSDDLRKFEWRHNLADNQLMPMSNPALYADIELGYITLDEARQYPFYEPDDKLSEAIVNQDFSMFAPEGGSGWVREPAPEGPPLPALITADEALQRGHGQSAEEETAAADETAAGTTPDGQAVEVGGDQPPPEDGGGGNEPPVEVGGGDTPPADGEGDKPPADSGGDKPPPDKGSGGAG